MPKSPENTSHEQHEDIKSDEITLESIVDSKKKEKYIYFVVEELKGFIRHFREDSIEPKLGLLKPEERKERAARTKLMSEANGIVKKYNERAKVKGKPISAHEYRQNILYVVESAYRSEVEDLDKEMLGAINNWILKRAKLENDFVLAQGEAKERVRFAGLP